MRRGVIRDDATIYVAPYGRYAVVHVKARHDRWYRESVMVQASSRRHLGCFAAVRVGADPMSAGRGEK